MEDDQTFDFSEQTVDHRPDEEIQKAAQKYDYAWGEGSPGPDYIATSIRTGQEGMLRDGLRVQKTIQLQQQRLNILGEYMKAKGGEPATPEETDFFLGLSEEMIVNPETIFETEYGHKLIQQLGPNGEESPIQEGLDQEPDGTELVMDIAGDVIAKSEITRKLYTEAQGELGQMSGFGQFVDFALPAFVPFYSWVDTMNALEGSPGGTVLQGANLQEQAMYAWTLPPDEFHRQVSAALAEMGSVNDKLTFLSALQGMSQNQEMLFNMFSIADVAFTAGPIVKGVGKRVLGAGLGSGVKRNAASIAAAASNPDATISTVLSASGRTTEAAVLDAISIAAAKAKNVGAGAGTKNSPFIKELETGLMTIGNPKAVLTGGSRLSTGSLAKIQQFLSSSSSKLMSVFDQVGSVVRMNPAEVQAAIIEEVGKFQRIYPRAGSQILNQRHMPAELSRANVDSLQIDLGKNSKSGPFIEPFKDQTTANFTAQRAWNLPKGSYTVEPAGSGFVVRIEHPLTETGAARDVVVATDNKPSTSWFDGILGWIRTPNEYLNASQTAERQQVVHGQTKITKLAKEVSEGLRGTTKNLRRMLDVQYKTPYTAPNGRVYRGTFSQTIADFERTYSAMFGRFPTEKEVKAYFTTKMFHEFVWYAKNLQIFRDFSRQGIQQVQIHLPHGRTVEPFYGKIIPELPDPSVGTAYTVLVIEPSGSKMVVHGAHQTKITAALRAGWNTAASNGQVKIIQVADSSENLMRNQLRNITQVSGSLDEPINFIVTKTAGQEPIKGRIIPFTPMQNSYQYRGSVSQSILSNIGTTGRRVYKGDRTIFSFKTEAEAQKYAGLVEEARKLYVAKDPAFDNFIRTNLAFETVAGWKNIFKTKQIDPGVPVTWTLPEELTTSIEASRRTGMDWKGIVNPIDSDHNLMRGVNPYLREEMNANPFRTMTVREPTKSNPLIHVDELETIDPLEALNRDVEMVMRSRMGEDYKIMSAEYFIKEFADVLKDTTPAMRRNPLAALYHGEFVKPTGQNLLRLQAAKNYRAAVMHLLGTPTATSNHIGHIQNKLLDSLYNKVGQKGSEFVEPYLMAEMTDPFKYFRAMAFHWKLGLFNIPQLFLQAQTMAVAAAIAGPKMAMKGIPASFLYRRLGLNSHPNIVAHMDSMATKFGWKPGEFKESWEALDRSGMFDVGAEVSWRDDANPRMFVSGRQKFLDWGSTFFSEGNRITRLTGYAIAYREWREANPHALFNRNAQHEVLKRADLLTVSQTRASVARLQQGITSMPLYFAGYQLRMMDLMLGKRLTWAEKARVFGVNSVLYGIPIATGSATGIPIYNYIREMLLQNGIETKDDLVVKALVDGFVATAFTAITGKENNAPERFGAPGLRIVEDMFQKDATWSEILLGAPFSVLQETIDKAYPLVTGLTAPLRGDKFDLLQSDFIDAGKSISSWNNTTKAWAMFQMNQILDKNGAYQTDADGWDAVMLALFGVTPMEVGDIYRKFDVMAGSRDAKREIEPHILRLYEDFFRNHDDYEYSQKLFRRINVYVRLGGFSLDEQVELWKKVTKSAGPKIDEVNMDFFKFLNTPEAPY